MLLLQRHTLWKNVVEKTGEALRRGALFPIPTEYEFIKDGGIRFFVRILSNLTRKDEAREEQERTLSSEAGKGNPFLPYEQDLFVAEVSDSHVALLNKYNVVEYHLLIITRQFEEQEMLLTLSDFEALWACVVEYDGLGFYNGGAAAGASQPHKHLQLVPLPLAPEGPQIPIEPLLNSWRNSDAGVLPGLPFLHAFARIPEYAGWSVQDSAVGIFSLYGELLRKVGLDAPDTVFPKRQTQPYCLLVTRSWMLLVPRSREFFDSVSINSLGFAGALLVRDRKQLEMLRKNGPMNVLRSVACVTQGQEENI